MARLRITGWMTSHLFLLWLAAAVAMQNVTHGDKRGLDSGPESNTDTPCFVLCNCSKTKADCSRNYGKLTFVPPLPEGIYALDFSYNNLREIRDPNFFINVTEVRTLDLGNNELTYLTKHAFQPFTTLQKLLLDNNPGLSLALIEQAVFIVNSLFDLSLRNTTLGKFPAKAFIHHPLPQLEKLNLEYSHLYVENLSVFAPLPRLIVLNLDKSKIAQVVTDSPLACKQILLSHSGLFVFPETCRNGRSMFPRLERLSLHSNYISDLPKDICLPELQQLYLGGNPITEIVPGMFRRETFPKLKKLKINDLQYIFTVVKLRNYAFNNTALSSLSLMNNNIDFELDAVDPDVFAGCTSLESLQVSHNYFGNVSDEKFQRLFAPLSNLRDLYMGSCSIWEITRHRFDACASVRKLSLYYSRTCHGGHLYKPCHCLTRSPQRIPERFPSIYALYKQVTV